MSEIDIENCSPKELAVYIRALQEKATKLEKENVQLHEAVKKQEIMLHNMNEMLVKGRKKMFGQSSEQIKYMDGSEQLTLFNEAEKEYDAGADEPTEQTFVEGYNRNRKRTQAELTENIPHKEVLIELDKDKKKCEICSTELTVIGKEKLRSELNIVPAQIFVFDYYRNVYKCAKCEKATDEAKVIKPDAPVAVMKKSMASPAAVAYVMQEKYQNGVPLFR